QYATWNRTRRLQQSQYIARTDTNTSRVATAMAQTGATNGIVIDMGNVGTTNAPADRKINQEPLFGPNIGFVSSGPSWAITHEKKVVTDDLTPEVVKAWIEKSKQPAQPTTTLQALVNLKRPTLRLSPLSSLPDTDDSTPLHSQQHGLEFEYDCDAPKCGVYVHVLLPKDHPDAPTSASPSGYSKLLVFETVTEGGFGKLLKLEDGAVLELSRFEGSRTRAQSSNRLSIPVSPSMDAAASPSPVDADGTATSENRNRRRFTHFHFKKKTNQSRSVSGPALAVVDMAEPKKDADDIKGVRITIRLAALDEMGTELMSPNEQVTYLHIVRFGAKEASPVGEKEENGEDSRPWVVKVVKREATIGPHTFHLHEIYGLTSSSSTHNPSPIAPVPEPSPSTLHSYPPQPSSADADDESLSECLLCLSAPREVVLLPCRHLVACRECALNMVEFGAGGTITQSEEPVGGAGASGSGSGGASGSAAGAAGTGTAAAGPSGTATTGGMMTARRKRKAKGWYCPVCRQPYTSLLRITTSPPEGIGEGAEESGHKCEHGEGCTSCVHDHAAQSGEPDAVNTVTTRVEGMGVGTPSVGGDGGAAGAGVGTENASQAEEGGHGRGSLLSGGLFRLGRGRTGPGSVSGPEANV
ncbi:hypothetical protein AMATHDRAFT_146631, partial [Amanita thiersii Skay4041]